ncbi:MAG: methyltransferase, TIGR04325 family [Cyanobacteriota bacterium]|nr:methyltransferase, TIGR04325 family [Cyanobacteriota bacterium]
MNGEVHPPAASLWRRFRRGVSPLVRAVIPSRLVLRGPYPSHAAALAEATGYDTPLVPQQVEEATVAVLEGRAAYERDGTAFATRPELPLYKVLRPLLPRAGAVADFGGGLGGLFLNAPELFPSSCRQIVIEQPSMVEAGRRLARRHRLPLEFLDASEQAIPAVEVLVFSCVLQYLPDPWPVVQEVLRQTAPAAVILDRTAVRDGPSRWYVQTNPGYYQAPVSYPVQVLDRRLLLEAFHGYRPVRRWHNVFDPGRPEHIGMLLLRDDSRGAAG